MGFVLVPDEPVRRGVRRVARERLGEAIELLDRAIGDDPAPGGETDTASAAHAAEKTVHEVRKRCKSVRGLARLVRPALGDDFRPFDRTVRAAANELSSLRDAHAVLSTLDKLLDTPAGRADPSATDLWLLRERQAARSAAATDTIERGDQRLRRSRDLLDEALAMSQRWKIPRGFDALGDGLGDTYGLGLHWWRRASRRPTDDRLHEWRKSVKYLWYQTRLLHDVAPSVMDPLVRSLDDLAEALGDDHDLAVLVDLLTDTAIGEGMVIEPAVELVRAQQDELRGRAFRLGRTVYAETEQAFVARVESYWTATRRLGPELTVGGIAAVSARRSPAASTSDDPGGPGVERERKFAVERIPDELDLSDAVPIRQGYLAIDRDVSVRVRDAGADGCTLTVKWRLPDDSPGTRGELEWRIPRDRFEALWPTTEGRQVVKTRHRLQIGDVTVELDVFHEALDGLIVAEVEFDGSDALASFAAPAWFGAELTDDRRYTNAALAVDGPPRA